MGRTGLFTCCVRSTNKLYHIMATDSMEIDDALYSRQRYVLGDTAMQKMAQSNVFLSGLGGLGVEIAKNIVLAGIKALTVHDTKQCKTWDLGTNFFICEDDVINLRNRAEATLPHIAELNPYVHVLSSTAPLDETTDISFLKKYQCVILTETRLSLQKKINDFCHAQHPPIKFISADVYGIWSRLFCDFGDEFEVLDTTGEEPKEIFISNITQSNPGIVTCLENHPHKLETGQCLTFREVHGMSCLNGSMQQITVVSPYSFSIGDTSDMEPYLHGGIAVQVKTPKIFCFERLEKQLKNPTYLLADFSKPEAPLQIHTAMFALNQFQENFGRMPNIGCLQDAEEMLKIAVSISETLESKVTITDPDLIEKSNLNRQFLFRPHHIQKPKSYTAAAATLNINPQLKIDPYLNKVCPATENIYNDEFYTKQDIIVTALDNVEARRYIDRSAQGFLAPLAAAVGGVASQEVLKAVTGKFSPLQQWLYIDALDIAISLDKTSCEEFLPRGDKYDALRVCIGESLCQKLHKLNVFLVGCGAIGCEMLKNFALLGVGSGRDKGMVTITDPDLIEKSNLNRQFLFRPHHIQKPKSYTAAAATLNINPQLKIDPYLNKVCPATENIYNDEFYTKQDIIVTALDNVDFPLQIYCVRCVANLRPLLDSGTMGTKGHTETTVPHLTESYNSHRDPPEEEIPFCTLKSFPAAIEHTIQWARDKFESAFSHKPSLFNKFWQTYPSAEEVLQRIKSGESLEGCFQAIKSLSRRPRNWSQCVELARIKFEKYFKHKALQLLHSFPLDTRLKDGSLFWQSPKRPPSPIKFEFNDPLHYSFIVSGAKLFARVYCVPVTEKVVQTDETARKPDHIPVSSEDERNAIFQLEKAILSNEALKNDLQMKMLSFEKDDDANGHIDFITAASNLRAKMYNIEPADRLKTKRIAGKIIPAIATATAAVSGLVALELIKIVGEHPFEAYKNCFLNLAIPIIVFTEAAEVRKTEIRNGISFTIWDRWTIYGKEDFTLLDFINAVREKYGIEPTMVVQGVKMLYVPVMPGHIKRLKLTMQKLVKPSADKKYVDLTVSFAPETDGDEDLPGPPVRYYFIHEDN
ncbi:Ubiquitin-like modifier-activating enzyme 6 [Chelonia mydas]|uniref:Ubiquitin-like modifier-activating enzyme 6 n=1 Tax=Chelonia mydas TaxID=8469 RepID=M7BHZ2_CHEMY|nr:Ubiquitin-like modifier-activating enzyme 6 [Chelonia mydas]